MCDKGRSLAPNKGSRPGRFSFLSDYAVAGLFGAGRKRLRPLGGRWQYGVIASDQSNIFWRRSCGAGSADQDSTGRVAPPPP